MRLVDATATALGPEGSLTGVSGNKKLDRKYAEHLAGLLRPIIEARFKGNQTAFAEHVGVSQSQISALLKVGGGDRSVGINVLIRLREYLQVSLDEMLGLPKLRKAAVAEVATVAVAASELEEAVTRALARRFPEASPEPAPVSTVTSPTRKRT